MRARAFGCKTGDADVSAPQQVALGPTAAAPTLAAGVVAQHGLEAPAGVPGYTFPFQEFLQPHLQGRLAQELAGLAGAEINW